MRFVQHEGCHSINCVNEFHTHWVDDHNETKWTHWFVILPNIAQEGKHKIVGPFDTWTEAGHYNASQGLRGEIHFAITPDEYQGHLAQWTSKERI